eukprot:8407619-Ditylum_brightwellii.AAC.1
MEEQTVTSSMIKIFFISYTSNSCSVTQVPGDLADCVGWGLAFMEILHSTFSNIPLWPCYYMPNNPQNTLGQQSLKQYNHVQAVNTEALEWLFLKDKHNTTIKIPSLPEYHSTRLLDYVKIFKGIFSKLANNLSYEALHRRLLHICKKKITSMCKQQTLIGLPKVKLICIPTKGRNRNKGKTIDASDLEPGNMLYMDITFFDIIPCRGFNCSLNIIDAKSRNLWFFLSGAKRIPLRIIKHFLHDLHKEDKT